MTKNSIQDRDNIMFCRAEGSYTRIYYSDKIEIYCSNLKRISEQLNMRVFIRCHHSYLVNIKKIRKVDIDRMQIELYNEYLVPISRRRINLIPNFEDLFKLKE